MPFPFQLKNSEVQELRDIGKIFFDGGNPATDDELQDSWKKWNYFFITARDIIDSRYGDFIHLPFSGGILNQPVKTMEVYRVIRNIYREKLIQDLKRIK